MSHSYTKATEASKAPALPTHDYFVGGSWTLSLEMVWYIGVSTLFAMSLNKSTNILVGFCLLVSFLAQISCAIGYHLPMGRLSMLLCCVLGLVCYRRDRGDISKMNFTMLFALLGLTIAFNLFVGLRLFPGAHPTATFRMAADSWALAAIIFFLPLFTRRAALWKHSALTFLGRISYSVYLLHGIVLYVLATIRVDGALLIGATFVTTVCISALTYQFIELPPIRFGHSLHLKQQHKDQMETT